MSVKYVNTAERPLEIGNSDTGVLVGLVVVDGLVTVRVMVRVGLVTVLVDVGVVTTVRVLVVGLVTVRVVGVLQSSPTTKEIKLKITKNNVLTI